MALGNIVFLGEGAGGSTAASSSSSPRRSSHKSRSQTASPRGDNKKLLRSLVTPPVGHRAASFDEFLHLRTQNPKCSVVSTGIIASCCSYYLSGYPCGMVALFCLSNVCYFIVCYSCSCCLCLLPISYCVALLITHFILCFSGCIFCYPLFTLTFLHS